MLLQQKCGDYDRWISPTSQVSKQKPLYEAAGLKYLNLESVKIRGFMELCNCLVKF